MTSEIITVEPKAYLLKNKVQNYEWGTKDKEAIIPELLGFIPEKGKPYAELWIGAHPKAPSSVQVNSSEVPLDEFINSNPQDILGSHVAERFSHKLPFLLKVLSASKALSIQAHPDKNRAKILHARDPKNYPDENHKPEIAIALDSLEALVGFKPLHEFLVVLDKYSGLKEFLGQNIYEKAKEKAVENVRQKDESNLIKGIYEIIIKKSVSEPEKLKTAIEKIKKEILSKSENLLADEERLFLKLEDEYGTDVGLFSVLFFNLIKLKEGEGIFLNAGVPHAYLKGNIIECMANSDNVVRAGLTPKFKDTDSLLEIITYDSTPVSIYNTEAKSGEVIYSVPVSEFEITKWKYAKSSEMKILNDSICIILIINGGLSIISANGTQNFKKGDSILIPAKLKEYSLKFSDDSLVFKAAIPHSQYLRLP